MMKYDSTPRTWEVEDSNTIVIFPGPEDDEFTHERYVWHLHRQGDCGPYLMQTISEGEALGPGGEIERGELCARPFECDSVQCDASVLFWCEGSPPPCGGDDE